MDYICDVLSVLVLLTRTIGIGLIALFSPKVLLGSVRKDIIYLINNGGGDMYNLIFVFTEWGGGCAVHYDKSIL